MQKLITIDRRIKIKNQNDVLELPHVVRVTNFDEKSAETFADDVETAVGTGQPVVPIVIDSYGGAVHSLLAMIAVVQSCPVPVATICVGKAMSCGSVLLSCGADGMRYADKNATVMIHDVSGFQFGKTPEVKASAAEQERLSALIFGIMAKNCGHKDPEHFTKILHEKGHIEWYLAPHEAKKHNIINHIKLPRFKVDVSVDISFS